MNVILVWTNETFPDEGFSYEIQRSFGRAFLGLCLNA